MQELDIRRAVTCRDLRTFATFPWKIYRDDPLWVPPILSERLTAMNPEKGPFFKHGFAEFYVARKNGRPVGTICTAVDEKANRAVHKQECVIGFFECVDDAEVARALLDHAVDWARIHGLNSLYGPFNLNYEDGYGVLIEGRDRPPAILCGHTKAAYRDYIESYGFAPARGENLAFARDLTSDLDKLKEIILFAEKVKKRKNFTIRTADMPHWKNEVDVVYELINPCLQHLPGYEPWQRETLEKLLEPFVDLSDPNLILFAEHEGKPIGFFPAIPNLNEVLIHINGLRYPWDYLKAAWFSRQKPRSASIKSVLVLPEYWGSGVAILLFAEMARRLIDAGYEWVDLSLTSDDNPRTPYLAERVGASVYKRYQVYRLSI